jgi:hypothetical protein
MLLEGAWGPHTLELHSAPGCSSLSGGRQVERDRALVGLLDCICCLLDRLCHWLVWQRLLLLLLLLLLLHGLLRRMQVLRGRRRRHRPCRLLPLLRELRAHARVGGLREGHRARARLRKQLLLQADLGGSGAARGRGAWGLWGPWGLRGGGVGAALTVDRPAAPRVRRGGARGGAVP